MKKLAWAPASWILCFGSFAAAGFAQQDSTLSLSNGLQLRISARLGNPTGQQTIAVELARASGDSFYRIFRDQTNLAIFAYEVAFAVSSDGSAVDIDVKPAGTEFMNRFPSVDGGKPTPTISEERQLEPLTFGQQTAIELFQIPGTGLNVSDAVKVRLEPKGASGSAGTLRLEVQSLTVNGAVVGGNDGEAPVAGRYVMFYIPGRGAYFLSSQEVPGHRFLKSGSIDGEHIRFTLDNAEYELTCSGPVLAGGGTGELWVYHDAAFKPAGNWTAPLKEGRRPSSGFYAAASESLGWWLEAGSAP